MHVGPLLRGATPATSTGAGTPRRIPDDVLRQVSRRLEVMSLIAATLWCLGPALGHLARARLSNDPSAGRWEFPDTIAVGSVIASLGMYWWLRRREHDPYRVMDLGLVYLVAMAFAIGVMMHVGPLASAAPSPHPDLTWIGPVILIFAVLQSVLAPWLLKITRRHANALIGGIGLLSTFVALLIAVLVPAAGIGIDGPVAWIVGTLIVWLVTALASWLLPPLFIKRRAQAAR